MFIDTFDEVLSKRYPTETETIKAKYAITSLSRLDSHAWVDMLQDHQLSREFALMASPFLWCNLGSNAFVYNLYKYYEFSVADIETLFTKLETMDHTNLNTEQIEGYKQATLNAVVSNQSIDFNFLKKYENEIGSLAWQNFFYDNKKVPQEVKKHFQWKHQPFYTYHYWAKYYDGRPMLGNEKDGVFFFENGDCELSENCEFLDDLPIEEFTKLCEPFYDKRETKETRKHFGETLAGYSEPQADIKL